MGALVGALTNPVVDELNSLSPHAKQALMQFHQASQTPPTMAPPPPSMQAPSAAPAVPGMSTAQPKVTNPPQPRGTLAGDQQALQQEAAKKPALESVYSKIHESGFGQAHPVAGRVLGALAQIPATAADIGLSAAAPRIGALVPGSTVQHGLRMGALQGAVKGETENQQKQAQGALETAQAAAVPSEVELRKAQTGEANARAEALENPKDSWQHIETDQGIFALNPRTHELLPLTFQGQPLQPHEKAAAEKGAEHVSLMDAKGKPYAATFDPNTKQYFDATGKQITNPIPYEKAPTVNVNAGLNEADKVAARLAKPFETSVTQGNNQLDKMDEAMELVKGNAEAQALGIPKTLTALVSGQGTGVRITMPELQLIARARGVQGDFEGFVRKIEGQGSLTKTQQQQLVGIIQDAKTRLQEKLNISNEALDKINGATDRGEVIRAEQEARQKLTQLERTGHYVGQTVTLKDGSQKVISAIHPDGSFDAN